jgi:hypothetical protein
MDDFLAAINPTSNQISEISTSHTALRGYLRSQLKVDADFLTGSYLRNTMLRQSRDVDMFIVLNKWYWDGSATWTGYGRQANGPANLLDYIRRLLQQKYPTTAAISRDGQAVTVEFAHVHVDVVPAFVSWSDYLIPDSPTNTWLRSNPGKHLESISQANSRVGNRLVPLAKMIKYWNFSHNYGMKGFFLEMWARDIFQYWSLPSYAEGIHSFFDTGISYIDSYWGVPDPGTGADLMLSYLGSEARRTSARSRFMTARDLAANVDSTV